MLSYCKLLSQSGLLYIFLHSFLLLTFFGFFVEILSHTLQSIDRFPRYSTCNPLRNENISLVCLHCTAHNNYINLELIISYRESSNLFITFSRLKTCRLAIMQDRGIFCAVVTKYHCYVMMCSVTWRNFHTF